MFSSRLFTFQSSERRTPGHQVYLFDGRFSGSRYLATEQVG
jgi:hypothetical protein